MESTLREFASDKNLYVLCAQTSQILKKGTGNLEDQETWAHHVVHLPNADIVEKFRAILAEENRFERWRKQEWNPDDDRDGSVPAIAA